MYNNKKYKNVILKLKLYPLFWLLIYNNDQFCEHKNYKLIYL